jgi:hypothetical protein
VVLLLGAGLALWRRGLTHLDTEGRVAAAAILILALCALSVVLNTGERSYDYRCYENAARDLKEGRNPYDDGCYLYPPLLAESLAAVHSILYRIAPTPSSSYDTWWLVFYVYRTAQFYLLIAALLICMKLGWKVLGNGSMATIVVAILFLLSGPIHRTLRFQQANMLGLAALGYAFLTLSAGKVRAGAILAISCAVKPLLALAPLAFLTRRTWRVPLSFALTLMTLVAVSVVALSGWSSYSAYLDSARPLTAYPVLLRDQSLLSLLWNTSHAMGGFLSGQAIARLLQALYIGFTAWVAIRILIRGRQRNYTQLDDRSDNGWVVGDALSDLVMLSLILSPLAWPHNYVIAIPPLIWGLGIHRRVRQPLVVAAFLMLLPVTFELFPLSYHRLVGAILFLVATSPKWARERRFMPDARGSNSEPTAAGRQTY